MTSAAVLVATVAGAAAAMIGWIAASSLNWVSRVHTDRLGHLSRVELAELFLFVDPRVFLIVNGLALILVPILAALVFGGAAAIFVAVLVMVAPSLVYRTLRRRRLRRLDRQLPDVAAAMAAGLRAGLSLGQALDFVVRHQPHPASQEFGLTLREHRVGLTLETALENLSKRNASIDLALLVATLGVARDLGGGLAEALERFAASLRRRLALEDRIDALTAQGRMQGWIMGLLPILIGCALGLMDQGFLQALFGSPIGWATLCIIAVLEVAGFVLIRRIVRIEI